MAGWTQSWTCAAAIAALALSPNLIAAGGLSASATVSPASGYAGAKLTATYSFTSKSSCSAFHNNVFWSFGNTMNWATSPVLSNTGTNCTSSTTSTAPPSGDPPGSYMVCGTDTSVTSIPACTTYTITPLPRPPTASPKPSPRTSPSPSPNSSTPVGATSGTPSPTASPGAPPVGGGGSGSSTFQAADRAGSIRVWPWTLLLVLLVVTAAAWRFRSWLMGVFENVVVLGRSGADLETQLLHHQASPLATGAIYTSTALPPGTEGETKVDQFGGDTTFDEPEGSGAETTPRDELEAPPPDPSANFEAEAIDAEAQPPPES